MRPSSFPGESLTGKKIDIGVFRYHLIPGNVPICNLIFSRLAEYVLSPVPASPRRMAIAPHYKNQIKTSVVIDQKSGHS